MINGECLNDADFGIPAFEVKEEDGFLLAKLPEENELESAISTSKWMVSPRVVRILIPKPPSTFACTGSRYDS